MKYYPAAQSAVIIRVIALLPVYNNIIVIILIRLQYLCQRIWLLSRSSRQYRIGGFASSCRGQNWRYFNPMYFRWSTTSRIAAYTISSVRSSDDLIALYRPRLNNTTIPSYRPLSVFFLFVRLRCVLSPSVIEDVSVLHARIETE